MKQKNVLVLVAFLVVAIGFAALSYFGIGSDYHTLSARNIKKGLDLSGGVYVLFEAKDGYEPNSAELDSAVAMIQTRCDGNGWLDAEVSKEGANRVRVEIPGVENVDEAVQGIGATASLTFRTVSEDQNGTLMQTIDGQMIMVGDPLLDGKNVKNATKQTNTDSNGKSEIVVSLEFDSEGKELFRQATADNIGKPLAICMDNVVISYPRVNTEISDGNAIISGSFTNKEAGELANQIRSGSLPFELERIEAQTIGASLGEDALKTSLFAGAIGIFLVLLFMLVFYKAMGFVADWALCIYLCLELLILNGLNITLTLPGIAGIILSVGMAVDANVIIFERIKEELASGRTLKVALHNGFSRAFPAIIDSNITTLIACGVLFWLGTGPVKGFAYTLGIGIVLSMFTALVITRVILSALVGVGIKNLKLFR